MIELNRVTKEYAQRHGRRTILREIDLSIEKGEHIGILGRNGAGKSTLIRLLAGSELPTSGTIRRSMSVSWPIAFSGGFQGSLTGLDNLRFICRIYEVDYLSALPFVEEFSGLGTYLKEPVKTYSSGMTARLAFAISMAIDFDCFLIDEVIAVGDADFQRKCRMEIFDKRADRTGILVSHDPHLMRQYCTSVYVLHEGTLHQIPDINEAYEFYARVNATF
ncbi:ABC transporter ATP-binding protein [Pararobbsia silviterrae]|uniref:ABC transporter ATP-binding protein n=1 Tax=Pararobbsia silviterrae TaxID=1792498 RepID=A0A494XIC9_9BURK|nr:ATP-binding cassette domain-containing protein [Pararobbsia silviterrae]RKP47834.1 ABC transporter ATP-binding protein [Pararobbsia silviterrae]